MYIYMQAFFVLFPIQIAAFLLTLGIFVFGFFLLFPIQIAAFLAGYFGGHFYLFINFVFGLMAVWNVALAVRKL